MNIAISNGISTATIQADQINLTGHTMAFTGGQITITTDNFTLDGSGNMWCQNGTFSGMVSGVHGSFKNLDCVDNNGNVVGSIKFGSDGRLWFSGDMYHQGSDNAKKRGYRFYAADILCRGMFGHRQKTVAYVSTHIWLYTTKIQTMWTITSLFHLKAERNQAKHTTKYLCMVLPIMKILQVLR